uniref:Uncharacterized protein n=1 Tax=Bionectria ochroleuca TaxID=29856 RepID=A0A8H7TQ55_BIOOC
MAGTMSGESWSIEPEIVGLEGAAEWLLEEVREWAGGVGGNSGPVGILFDWRFNVGGLGGSKLIAGTSVSMTISETGLDGGEASRSLARILGGRGKTLCFLN